jgi:hypothetical protein
VCFVVPQRIRAAKSSLTRPAAASLRAAGRPCGPSVGGPNYRQTERIALFRSRSDRERKRASRSGPSAAKNSREDRSADALRNDKHPLRNKKHTASSKTTN